MEKTNFYRQVFWREKGGWSLVLERERAGDWEEKKRKPGF